MNKQRAEEIAQAPNLKHVTYNGKQVYIQHVNEQSNTARIYPLDDPTNEFEVQLTNLFEK
ncbi:H-type small acid-soluble spore protein [Lederbergia lenta]|uniref:Small, acid-soluble spore protein H n=1 Tax=Lederbergia lenta TaxID=1467 RepID=A0A2X4W5L8_LEDLE|nr:H-type small acid-soluble spore protein [Lederbergia lenta]MCM3112454.1 H-type small acid-soluble spore protein [Lederbergia lenta]MEC2323487.1 H-type small acid-soluble spore protein [Lederbergia lenta]SQI52900.1 small, acid-soluble spore protein H [Lederbergia lenta]